MPAGVAALQLPDWPTSLGGASQTYVMQPFQAQAAQLLLDMARKNSKLPDQVGDAIAALRDGKTSHIHQKSGHNDPSNSQVMVSSLLSACVQHNDLDSLGRLGRDQLMRSSGSLMTNSSSADLKTYEMLTCREFQALPASARVRHGLP